MDKKQKQNGQKKLSRRILRECYIGRPTIVKSMTTCNKEAQKLFLETLEKYRDFTILYTDESNIGIEVGCFVLGPDIKKYLSFRMLVQYTQEKRQQLEKLLLHIKSSKGEWAGLTDSMSALNNRKYQAENFGHVNQKYLLGLKETKKK